MQLRLPLDNGFATSMPIGFILVGQDDPSAFGGETADGGSADASAAPVMMAVFLAVSWLSHCLLLYPESFFLIRVRISPDKRGSKTKIRRKALPLGPLSLQPAAGAYRPRRCRNTFSNKENGLAKRAAPQCCHRQWHLALALLIFLWQNIFSDTLLCKRHPIAGRTPPPALARIARLD
ncbi:MAG: hypothetical protein ACLSAH_14520 [Bilophila wadsworthia]